MCVYTYVLSYDIVMCVGIFVVYVCACVCMSSAIASASMHISTYVWYIVQCVYVCCINEFIISIMCMFYLRCTDEAQKAETLVY